MTKNKNKVNKRNQLLAAGLIVPALVAAATVPVEASETEEQLNETSPTEGAEQTTPETLVDGGDTATPDAPVDGEDVESTEDEDITTPETPTDVDDTEPTEPTDGEEPTVDDDVEPTDPTEGEDDTTTPETPTDGDDTEPTDPTEGEDDTTTPEEPTDGDDVEPTDPTEGDDDTTTPEEPTDGDDVEPTDPTEDEDVTTPETPTDGEDVEPTDPTEGEDDTTTPEEPTDGDTSTGDTGTVIPGPTDPTDGEDVTEPVVPTEPTVPVTPEQPTEVIVPTVPTVPTETPQETVITENENVQNPDVTLPSEPMSPTPTVVESTDLKVSFVSKNEVVGTLNVELVEKDGYYFVLIRDDNGLVEVDGKIQVSLKVSEFKYVTKVVDGKVTALKYKYDAEAGLIILELDSLDELIHLTSEKKEITGELKENQYADYIVELYSRSVLKSDDIQGFKPNQSMNRQTFMSILDTVSDESISDTSTAPTLTRVEAALLVQELIAKNTNIDVNAYVDNFQDTTGLSTNERTAIGLLKELGIVHGKTPTSFDPNALLTSGQMSKIIANTLAFLESNNQ